MAGQLNRFDIGCSQVSFWNGTFRSGDPSTAAKKDARFFAEIVRLVRPIVGGALHASILDWAAACAIL